MSDTVIQIASLSKKYRLGTIGGKRLVDDINRQWARFRGKPDPLSKVVGRQPTKAKSGKGHLPDEIWALKDVTLEVKQGEILGIIGRNGAGKSTLLKILSRVTAPTSGEIRVKGRIASLLEVGTGFHPELTGRENVFLNGAILGMTKAEIKQKFDEIVEFSGCARYIDTPVKRYSSGMWVRLAFAVAAHLEPEILVVDEVLAVGDAEFQSKAIGKMQDISMSDCRTILFVSHDMNAIRNLCTRVVILDRGLIKNFEDVCVGIDYYLAREINITKFHSHVIDDVSLTQFGIFGDKGDLVSVEVFKSVAIKFELELLGMVYPDIKVSILIKDDFGQVQTAISSALNSVRISPRTSTISCECTLTHGFSLSAGNYHVDLHVYTNRNIQFNNIFSFRLMNSAITGYKLPLIPHKHGRVYTPNSWNIKKQLKTI